jgi:NAD(P)-dependent dehydrogenase (short-subunit alcohol dehydrogenase family)
VSEERLDALLSLNVRSMLLVAQAGARKMLEHPERARRGGAIVNMSSQMGHVGQALRSVYVMAKHALDGLKKAATLELAPRGIRVVSIAPTIIETPMVADRIAEPDFADRVLSRACRSAASAGRRKSPLRWCSPHRPPRRSSRAAASWWMAAGPRSRAQPQGRAPPQAGTSPRSVIRLRTRSCSP